MRLHDETWKNIVTKWTSSKTFRTELYLTEKNPSPKGLFLIIMPKNLIRLAKYKYDIHLFERI